MLVMSNGMSYGDLTTTLEGLKSSSKAIGTHARRTLYWDAYSQLISKVTSMEGTANCFLLYRSDSNESDDGIVEIIDMTKRQRGLVNGACEFMGPKMKPPDDADSSSKSWCMVFSESDAERAWEDIMHSEPCIYISPDAVYVATRFKRILCKKISSPIKNLKEAEQIVGQLQPDNPLRSIAFAGNSPPAVNQYNTFFAGPLTCAENLPPAIGHVKSTSPPDIYDYFVQRRNEHYVVQAESMIAQMLTSTSKGQAATVNTGKKEATVAVKNSLMKSVFVHESMTKFIDYIKKDGSVELTVIEGKLEELGKFGEFGGLVFELFYAADLSTFA